MTEPLHFHPLGGREDFKFAIDGAYSYVVSREDTGWCASTKLMVLSSTMFDGETIYLGREFASEEDAVQACVDFMSKRSSN